MFYYLAKIKVKEHYLAAENLTATLASTESQIDTYQNN